MKTCESKFELGRSSGGSYIGQERRFHVSNPGAHVRNMETTWHMLNGPCVLLL